MSGVLLEDLDRDDLRHAEFRGELFQVAVEATPHTVLEKEAVGDVVLGREEDGLTRAAVELAVLDDGRDDLIERRVRVVDVDVHAVGVELVVGRDGPDALLVDLVLVRDVTTVADENRTRDFLVQHETHLGLEPHDDVEVGDVHDVIAVQRLLLVDGGRGRDALRDREELFLLQGAGDVTLGSGLVAGDVRPQRLDAGERALAGAAEKGVDPLHPATEELRLVAERLGVGEQGADVLDAVLKTVRLDGGLHRTETLGVLDDAVHGVVCDDGLRLGLVALEDVVHLVSFLVVHVAVSGVVGFGHGLDGRTDEKVDDILLFVRECFVDLLDGAFATVCVLQIGVVIATVGVLVGVIFVFIVVLVGIRVLDVIRRVRDEEAGRDDRGVLERRVFASVGMTDRHGIDERTRICTREHQADLTNDAVHDTRRPFEEVVCPDRQHVDVAVLNTLLGGLSLDGIVEESVGVDPIFSVLEDGVTEDVLRIGVTVLPDERNSRCVLIPERVRENGPTIGALQSGLGCVAAEICFHFDFLPLSKGCS